MGAAILVAVALTGCSSTPRTAAVESGPRSYSFWPQFPAEPRIQFLVSYRFSDDIEPESSGLDNLLYGERRRVLPIAKLGSLAARR